MYGSTAKLNQKGSRVFILLFGEKKKWVLSTGCCGKKGKAFLVYFLFLPIFKALLPFCERTVSLVNLENVRAYEEQPLKFVPERLSRFGICLFVFPGRKK